MKNLPQLNRRELDVSQGVPPLRITISRKRGVDNGIWRRIKIIPFDVTIPPEQRDKNLTEKLISENAGILNWLIQGYAMWKKEGLGDADAVSKANEEYRMDMDAVGTFVNDCLERQKLIAKKAFLEGVQ